MTEKLKNLDVLAEDLCVDIIDKSYEIIKNLNNENVDEDIKNLVFAIQSVSSFSFIPRLAELAEKLKQNPDKVEPVLSEILKLAKEIKENGFEPVTEKSLHKIAFIKTKQGTFAINADFITRIVENGGKNSDKPTVDLTPDTKEAFIIYIKVKDKELALLSAFRPYLIDEDKVDKEKITFLNL